MSYLNLSDDSNREPNIRKAKFYLNEKRIYTLDFDHNIQMKELKLMIQKAAHLKRNTFKLFSNGEEYTQYNEEIFDNLFPHQSLVLFTLEIGKDVEMFDETELLLQMNSPCSEHIDKFLLYYCLTCNTSICSECFTNGKHKNHKIQDKCFYLLPSKYLVEKMFENWSQRPYEDYKISVDLSELKTKVNTVMFDDLFKMLKKVQEKCNSLIDEYNQINQSSLGNIRDSVRDIKVSCIKALDNLKEELNIKDIVNNQDIFVEFDSAYKELGKIQNAKFQQNLLVFQELNKQVSSLVSNLIHQIYSLIHKTLNDSLNEQQYENVKYQITQKFIRPIDKDNILAQMNEYKKKRKTYINSTNFAKSIALSVQNKLNSDQGKNLNTIQNNINIDPFIAKKNDTISNQKKTEINLSSNQVNFGYVDNSLGQNAINYSPLSQNAKFGVNTSVSNNLQDKTIFAKPETIISNISENNKNNINSSLNSNYGAQIKIGVKTLNPYSSAQTTRQFISNNLIPKIKTDTSNIISASEKKSINQIDSSSNIITNTNNSNQFGFNNNISTQINLIPNNQQQVYKTIETKTTTIVPNIINNIMDNNIISSYSNLNHNGQINQHTIRTYATNNSLSNYGNYINRQRNNNIEEVTESETEILRPTDVRRFLNTEYILSPVSQTNSIKIITSDNREERTVPLKFPENYGFNTFFLDCAHCNCSMNRCLYVAGGIESTSEQKRSNSLLCIDITKPDEYKVVKKASMNYARCAHTMISDDKYIYAVGGEDLNTVERYDIENDIWEVLPNMRNKRMYPILYVYKGYLYAFFGKFKNGEYPDSIERLNISNNSGIAKPSWEIVIFSNKKKININYYGCALHEINGILYFFGGKCDEQTTDQIFFYNFESNSIEKEDSNLLWKEYFKENKLHKLGETLVQCSENKYFGVYLNLNEQ